MLQSLRQVVQRAASLRECRSSDHPSVGVQRLGGSSLCQCRPRDAGPPRIHPARKIRSSRRGDHRTRRSIVEKAFAANPIGHVNSLSPSSCKKQSILQARLQPLGEVGTDLQGLVFLEEENAGRAVANGENVVRILL